MIDPVMAASAQEILGRPLSLSEVEEAEYLINATKQLGLTGEEVKQALTEALFQRVPEDPLTAQLFSPSAATKIGLVGSQQIRLRLAMDLVVKAGRRKGMKDKAIIAMVMKHIRGEISRREGWIDNLTSESCELASRIGSLAGEFDMRVLEAPLDGLAPETAGSIISKESFRDFPWDKMNATGWTPPLDGHVYRDIGIDIKDLSDFLNSCSTEERRSLLEKMIKAETSKTVELFTTSLGQKWKLDGTTGKGHIDFMRVLLWLNDPLVLQKQEGTHYHDMVDAIKKGDRFYRLGSLHPAGEKFDDDALSADSPLFHIEHDWARLLSRSDGVASGAVQLPFPSCAFEMKISGKRTCAVAYQFSDTGIGISVLVEFLPRKWMGLGVWECRDGGPWVHANHPSQISWSQRLADLIGGQIRATAVMLEAEVAETQVIRAPHKLNRAREKKGQLPLFDFHVVNLAKRHRVAKSDEPLLGEKRRSPRLHFRRGHWVHFARGKTWRKWCLVGDESLGWVDKEYKL